MITAAVTWGKSPRRRRALATVRAARPARSVISDGTHPAGRRPGVPAAAPGGEGRSRDRGPWPGQTLRLHRGGGRPEFRRAARDGDWFPRPERVGQIHHHADDPGAG